MTNEAVAWEFKVEGPHSRGDPKRYVWQDHPGEWRDDHEVFDVTPLEYGNDADDSDAVGWEAEYYSSLNGEWQTDVFETHPEGESVRNVKSLVPVGDDRGKATDE